MGGHFDVAHARLVEGRPASEDLMSRIICAVSGFTPSIQNLPEIDRSPRFFAKRFLREMIGRVLHESISVLP